jgi:uncharacterized protein YbaR (Trm112 family)
MDQYLLNCPKCHEVILKSNETEAKVRGKCIVLKKGQAFSVCKRCDTEVQIPLMLDDVLVKSLKREKTARLYLK